MTRIRKAVLPVAGLGTRFLPASKAVPKEMITVVDRPAIQWVIEEAFAAGIEHAVLVTGRNKSAIEDHFDHAPELEATLRERGKEELLNRLLADLPAAGRLSYTRQQRPLGLGHAVACARDIIGEEPFALLLPDMLSLAEPGHMSQLMKVYEKTGGNIIAVEEVPREDTHKYGVVAIGEAMAEGVWRITGMVEKPAPEDAPSNLIISGRYILQPEIFRLLADQAPGAGGEIQITDAMKRLLAEQPFFAVRTRGETHDCGSPLGFLKANLAFALNDPALADDLRAEMARLLKAAP